MFPAYSAELALHTCLYSFHNNEHLLTLSDFDAEKVSPCTALLMLKVYKVLAMMTAKS